MSRLHSPGSDQPTIRNSSFCHAAGLVRSAPGRSVLQGWGYGEDDVAEVEERLQAMAGAFEHDDV